MTGGAIVTTGVYRVARAAGAAALAGGVLADVRPILPMLEAAQQVCAPASGSSRRPPSPGRTRGGRPRRRHGPRTSPRSLQDHARAVTCFGWPT